MKVVLEKRLEQSLKAQIGLPVLSALMALVFCGVFFALTGKDPLLVYESMFSGALGNDYGLSETFVKMIPMALCALGIAVAFRMQIWNIGAEGQFYMECLFWARWQAACGALLRDGLKQNGWLMNLSAL